MIKIPDKKSIGIRIHDMHYGLVQTSGAIVESQLSIIKELGAAVQLATMIKDHETIKDMNQLYGAAGELKIQRPLTIEALKCLEKLDFVRLKYSTGKSSIKRVDITIPSYSKVYTDIGDYFLSENESDLAKSAILILDFISRIPCKEKDVISYLSLNTDSYDCLKEIGRAASFIDTYFSRKDSESIIYTPLYWDDKPNAIQELQTKYSSLNIMECIKKVECYQGIPGDNIDNTILSDGIALGCFPTLSVSSSAGLKKFVFTPRQGISEVEKSLLLKARVLLACIRYGENFAGITRIFDPELLLTALNRRGYLKGHSESINQYESARNYGLVKIIPTGNNRYEVHFIDNDENKKAVSIALEMLQIGQIKKVDNNQDVAKKLLLPSSLNHPIQTRIHVLKEQPTLRSRKTTEKINDIIRGVSV